VIKERPDAPLQRISAILRQSKVPDTHVSSSHIFHVPQSNLTDFLSVASLLIDATKKGTMGCLYYGYAKSGNKVMVREGYTSAAAVAQHAQDVADLVPKLMGTLGAEPDFQFEITGPPSELGELKEPLKTLPVHWRESDGMGFWLQGYPTQAGSDTHVSAHHIFNVPVDKMNDFLDVTKELADATAGGTKECIYYGFARDGNTITVREGYASADGVLAHANDTNSILPKFFAALGDSADFKMRIVGSKEELQKLRGPLASIPVEYFETIDGAFCQFGNALVGWENSV